MMGLKISKKNKDKTLMFLSSMSVETGKIKARLVYLSTHLRASGKGPEFESTVSSVSTPQIMDVKTGSARAHRLNQS